MNEAELQATVKALAREVDRQRKWLDRLERQGKAADWRRPYGAVGYCSLQFVAETP